MRGFTIIWAGQLVSLLGTGMTQFTITIWAWQTTGIATTLALVGFFTAVPQILTSPLAGAIVSLVSYGIREIRDLESLIPDHNTASRQADPA